MSKLLRGLTAQLLLVTVLPLTFILALISFGSIAIHQQAMRDMVGERDLRTAVAVANALGATIRRKMDVLGTLAARAAVGTETGPANWLTATLGAEETAGGVALYDRAGRRITATAGAQTWVHNLTQLPAAPFVIPYDGPYDEGLLVGAHDADRRVVAVGMFPLSALDLQTPLTPATSHGKTDAFVFDSNGRILYHTEPALVNTDARLHGGIAEVLRGEQGVLYRSDVPGAEEHVIAYAPITTAYGPTGLGIVIEEPWEEVLDPLMRYSQAVPLVTLPVLLLAVLAVVFGLRRIVQPLQQLDRQAREIGRGNYAALGEDVRGIEEIEQLHASLTTMAAQIQADQERLRTYARVVTDAQETERQRLARELHDDTIQNLIVLSQRVQAMRPSVRDNPPLAARLEELRATVLRMIEDVRRFSRALRPIYLEDAGLVAALERLADEANPDASGAGARQTDVTFTTSGPVARLKPEVELALYRIAQEALANALRHAGAGHVHIRLDAFAANAVRLSVIDDGQGFDESAILAPGAAQRGFGLLGIRERAMLIGAQVEVASAPGKGTRVTVSYPVSYPRR